MLVHDPRPLRGDEKVGMAFAIAPIDFSVLRQHDSGLINELEEQEEKLIDLRRQLDDAQREGRRLQAEAFSDRENAYEEDDGGDVETDEDEECSEATSSDQDATGEKVEREAPTYSQLHAMLESTTSDPYSESDCDEGDEPSIADLHALLDSAIQSSDCYGNDEDYDADEPSQRVLKRPKSADNLLRLENEFQAHRRAEARMVVSKRDSPKRVDPCGVDPCVAYCSCAPVVDLCRALPWFTRSFAPGPAPRRSKSMLLLDDTLVK